MENQVMRDARPLQFSKKEKKSGLNTIAPLSLIIGKTLGSKTIQTYFGNGFKTQYNFCDKVKQEYAMYQMEKIPESFIKKKRFVCEVQNPRTEFMLGGGIRSSWSRSLLWK